MADGMTKEEYALEWLRFAEMDFSTAEYLLGHRPLPVEIICYHCQQSTEKWLKGFLVIQGIRPPKTHDLVELYNLCEPFSQNIQNIRYPCDALTKYSVQPRYPFYRRSGGRFLIFALFRCAAMPFSTRSSKRLIAFSPETSATVS
jgi:HEPN domain-containing protein